MPARAREALISVSEDASPNMVAGRSTVEPIPFPADAITGVTDWVIFTSGAGEVSNAELDRASTALQRHLELIARTDGWRRIGAHDHPQLESEPDD